MGKILAFIIYIGMFFSPIWYKLRYLSLKPIKIEKKDLTITEIKTKVKELLNSFKYTADGVRELGDAIIPPDHAYTQLVKDTLYDDCDGFHAGVYEMIKNAGYKTCLVTSVNEYVMSNHVMVLFQNNSDIYLVNYDRVIKLMSINNISRQEFNYTLKEEFTKQCSSQSYFMFGQVFTNSRWFKRINLYNFFKKTVGGN